jgi:hypothetical protein
MSHSALYDPVGQASRLPVLSRGATVPGDLSTTTAVAQPGDFRDLLAQSLGDLATGHAPGVGLASGDWESSSEDAEDIRRVARDMEAMLLYHLLKDMWPSFPSGVLFDRGIASQFYRELWLEELAGMIAHQGSGIGIADVVERELAAPANPMANPADDLRLSPTRG